MKLFWSFAVSLLPLCSSYAGVTNEEQQAIQHPSSDSISHERLSHVIAASPLLSLHRAICEVESISINELAVGKLIISILEAHNFTVKTQNVPSADATNSTKERLNIYAYPDVSKYGGSKSSSETHPKVLLTSHIDTVPPHIPYSLSLPKRSSSRKDILISGRGTVDDKACVAVQIQTVLDLLSSATTSISPSDLALLFVVGEEISGDGMRHFSNSPLYESTKTNYKAVLFGEPTEGKLAAGHKGVMMLTLKAHGKAAHSGYPWLGRSATSMILPALNVLDKLGDLPEEEGGLPRSKKYGKSTLNVGFMQGGVAANVVPEFAFAQVAFRIAGGTLEGVREIVTKAVRSADPEELLDLEFSPGFGPVDLDVGVDGFDTITVNYGTDIPNLDVGDGVKRYLYGPGSIQVAHGRDEGLTVGDLEGALEGYKRLVKHSLKE